MTTYAIFTPTKAPRDTSTEGLLKAFKALHYRYVGRVETESDLHEIVRPHRIYVEVETGRIHVGNEMLVGMTFCDGRVDMQFTYGVTPSSNLFSLFEYDDRLNLDDVDPTVHQRIVVYARDALLAGQALSRATRDPNATSAFLGLENSARELQLTRSETTGLIIEAYRLINELQAKAENGHVLIPTMVGIFAEIV